MDSDTPLDHARFQLSPTRSRCELFVSGGGKTEKIASGFLKPFLTHLKVAEEQAALSAPSFKLEVERRRNASTWFNRGTLERFVRFVSTPDVLELVNTFDAEMSKLEEARGIYMQGSGDQLSGGLGENERTSTTVDITKRGLLRAVDSRLVAVKQDLTMACARASAAGFTLSSVSELHLFAQHFGAHHLSEACSNFTSLCQRRPELTGRQWSRFDVDDDDAGSTSGSDMSIDDPDVGPSSPVNPAGSGPHCHPTCQHPNHAGKLAESGDQSGSRRVSALDRINLFKTKQNEHSTIAINIPAKAELRRLHSDISADKAVLKRRSSDKDTMIATSTPPFSLDPHAQFSYKTNESKMTVWKESSSSQETAGAYREEAEEEDNRDLQGMKLHRQTSGHTQIRKLQDWQVERIPAGQFNGPPSFPGTSYSYDTEVFEPASASSMEQIQTARPTRGNQQLNDELRLKADELERIFAAHKRRVYGNQMASSYRSMPEGSTVDHSPKSVEKIPSEGSIVDRAPKSEVDGSLLKMKDNEDHVYNTMEKLGNLGKPEDSRGEFYERYMQKRDAKLREEWGSKRAQKEVKMKAMQDSLEKSRAEMEARFTGSADRQEMAIHARRHSALAIKEQTVKFLQSEEEYDLQQSSEQVQYHRNKSYNGSSRSIDSNKLLSSRSVSSSTARTSVTPAPRPTVKTSTPAPVRRKNQASIPNSTDFRKENTKPSNGTSKVSNGAQLRSFARSKSTIERANIFKEEKPGRSQSQRKGLALPGETKDQRSSESKPFLRKGHSVGPSSGALIAKRKPSFASEILKNGEESEASVNMRRGSPEMFNAEDGDFERGSARFRADDFPADSDCEYATSSHVLMSPYQGNFYDASSNFIYSPENVQESPLESPGSWSSHLQNSFSYAREASNIDASVDSPTGSPASWNTHPLNQIREAEAARIRKKWGSVQKPFIISSYAPQSPKDVTKGFKRLFGFGRKSKGTGSMSTDGVSTSATSEGGDDDTEDGHDQPIRSPRDPRMSRMGYPRPAYDGFNVDESFHEQQAQSSPTSISTPRVDCKLREDHQPGISSKSPRSFFSLPSFRSRASESRLRGQN